MVLSQLSYRPIVVEITGIEPMQPELQSGTLPTELYFHKVEITRFELVRQSYQDCMITISSYLNVALPLGLEPRIAD